MGKKRKTQELISIIVPVYNVEQYLGRCLESVLNQSYEKIEIIAVDDGSTDACSRILDEYAESHNNIFVVHIENSGVSNARNVGLGYAHGEIIGFVDSDDYVHPDMYRVLYRSLKEKNADISCCQAKWVFESEAISEDSEMNNESKQYSAKDGLQEILLGGESVVWRYLFKKKAILGLQFESFFIGEDAVFLVELMASRPDLRIVETNIVAYFWYQRRDSARTCDFSEWKWTSLDAADRILAIVEEKMPEMKKYAEVLHFKYYMGIISQLYASDSKLRYADKIIDIKRELKREWKVVDKGMLGKFYTLSYIGMKLCPMLYKKLALYHYKRVLRWEK